MKSHQNGIKGEKIIKPLRVAEIAIQQNSVKPYKYQEAKAVPIRVIFSDPIKVMHNLVAFVPKGIYA